MNKEEKKCKGCSCWCSCYDEDGDQTPKYCDACGGYYRERAEELRAEVERLEKALMCIFNRGYVSADDFYLEAKLRAKAEGGEGE